MQFRFQLYACLFITILFSIPSVAFEWQPILKENEKTISKAARNLDQFVQLDANKSLGIFTDSVLIIQNDKIIYERYYNGFNEKSRHQLWSISKSISSAIVGILEKEGKLEISNSLCNYFAKPNIIEPFNRCKISLKNVLEFSTGISWKEEYGSLDPTKSSVINMLYGDGAKDVANYVFTQTMETEAGKKWTYSTGDTMLLWGALKTIFTPEEYEDLPWKTLFNPLEMSNITFEQDTSGTYMGGSYIFASPRMLARFGKLYLDEGLWNGKEILPKSWIQYSLSISPAFIENPTPSPKNTGAHHWWVNKAVPEQGVPKPWPSAPDDTFAALGVFGQAMFIIPSKQVIAIRLGHDIANGFDKDKFLQKVLALVEEK